MDCLDRISVFDERTPDTPGFSAYEQHLRAPLQSVFLFSLSFCQLAILTEMSGLQSSPLVRWLDHSILFQVRLVRMDHKELAFHRIAYGYRSMGHKQVQDG